MKLIKFDLPINGTKVKNLDELRDNLTDEILALARRSQLERWLRTRQLLKEAQAVADAVKQEPSDKELFLALCEVLAVEIHPDDVKAIFDAPPVPGRFIPGARYFELNDELRMRVAMEASKNLMNRSLPLMSRAKPVIALVGGFGAGKSTLFNQLNNSCGDGGCNSDRNYGNSRLGKHEFIVIDTAGFESDAGSGIFKEMAKQTEKAVAESDVVIFVVDARGGSLSADDHEIAHYLRHFAKPTLVVANKKAKNVKEESQLVELYKLGLGEVIPVSAQHDHAVRSMLESVLDRLF